MIIDILVFRRDAWEIDRKDLVINEKKKLGAGAFGAVYIGKIINATNRPMNGLLLTKYDNEVAVKMLPGICKFIASYG